MTNSIMYQEDGFVVLETDREEQFLTSEELSVKLKGILQQMQDNLPQELQKFNSTQEQVQHLIATSCELDIAPGKYLQWYVVRFEK